MKPRYSPTPWRADDKLIQSAVRGPIAVTRVGPRHDEHEAEANARRIVECVNACEGIEDPAAIPKILKAFLALVPLTPIGWASVDRDVKDALDALEKRERT